MLEATPEKMPVEEVREGRTSYSCEIACYFAAPTIQQQCIKKCEGGKMLEQMPVAVRAAGSITDELEGFSIPSIYSSAPAQPIDPG